MADQPLKNETHEELDFRRYDSPGSYGVVTAYCEGFSRACPDFVKNAVNQ